MEAKGHSSYWPVGDASMKKKVRFRYRFIPSFFLGLGVAIWFLMQVAYYGAKEWMSTRNES